MVGQPLVRADPFFIDVEKQINLLISTRYKD